MKPGWLILIGVKCLLGGAFVIWLAFHLNDWFPALGAIVLIVAGVALLTAGFLTQRKSMTPDPHPQLTGDAGDGQ